MIFLKRYSYSLTFIIGITIIFILFADNGLPDKYFLSLIGAFITLYIGLTQYKLNNDRIFKELFNNFNEKYDKRFSKLINTISNQKNGFTLSEKQKVIIIDYLNLSAEEFLWYKKGRIPKDVWESWKTGIEKNLSLEQIRDVAENEFTKYKASYYGLFEILDGFKSKSTNLP